MSDSSAPFAGAEKPMPVAPGFAAADRAAHPTSVGSAQPSPGDAGRSVSAFVPLLLLSLAFVGWIAFQSVQLGLEHRQLANAAESLSASEQQSVAVRRSLDSLAGATARLAAAGNGNARRIVDELRRRGITIDPTAPSVPP